jgi:methylase of polypeptide subunit release factors
MKKILTILSIFLILNSTMPVSNALALRPLPYKVSMMPGLFSFSDKAYAEYILKAFGVSYQGLAWNLDSEGLESTQISSHGLNRQSIITAFGFEKNHDIMGDLLVIQYNDYPVLIALIHSNKPAYIIDLINYYSLDGKTAFSLRKKIGKHLFNKGIKEYIDCSPKNYHLFSSYDRHGNFTDVDITANRMEHDRRIRRFLLFPGVFTCEHTSSAMIAKAAGKYVKPGMKVLVIGSGAGMEAIIAAEKGAYVDAVDINVLAVENTRFNCVRAGMIGNVKVFANNLYYGLGVYDMIIFSMPHVAFYNKDGFRPRMNNTSKDEDATDLNGRLLKKFAADLKTHLTADGTALIINDRDPVVRKIIEETGLSVSTDMHEPKSASQLYIISNSQIALTRSRYGSSENVFLTGRKGFFGNISARQAYTLNDLIRKKLIGIKRIYSRWKIIIDQAPVRLFLLDLSNSADRKFPKVFIFSEFSAKGVLKIFFSAEALLRFRTIFKKNGLNAATVIAEHEAVEQKSGSHRKAQLAVSGKYTPQMAEGLENIFGEYGDTSTQPFPVDIRRRNVKEKAYAAVLRILNFHIRRRLLGEAKDKTELFLAGLGIRKEAWQQSRNVMLIKKKLLEMCDAGQQSDSFAFLFVTGDSKSGKTTFTSLIKDGNFGDYAGLIGYIHIDEVYESNDGDFDNIDELLEKVRLDLTRQGKRVIIVDGIDSQDIYTHDQRSLILYVRAEKLTRIENIRKNAFPFSSIKRKAKVPEGAIVLDLSKELRPSIMEIERILRASNSSLLYALETHYTAGIESERDNTGLPRDMVAQSLSEKVTGNRISVLPKKPIYAQPISEQMYQHQNMFLSAA